jgi:hypothetical protein
MGVQESVTKKRRRDQGQIVEALLSAPKPALNIDDSIVCFFWKNVISKTNCYFYIWAVSTAFNLMRTPFVQRNLKSSLSLTSGLDVLAS